MAVEMLAAATGRHDVIPLPRADDEHWSRFVAWWKALVRESTTVKRAPPPIEDDIDVLVMGVIALMFVLVVW